MINKLNKLGLGMVEDGVETLDPLRGARASSAGEGGGMTLRHTRRRRKVQSAGEFFAMDTFFNIQLLILNDLLSITLYYHFNTPLFPPMSKRTLLSTYSHQHSLFSTPLHSPHHGSLQAIYPAILVVWGEGP